MRQLHEYTLQLKEVPNPFGEKFAVGTFCSTHELVNYTGNRERREFFWNNNGHFNTVVEYKNKYAALYG